MAEDNATLIEAMLREADEQELHAMIQEFGVKRVTGAVEPLLRWVSPDYEHSGTVIVALGKIGDPLAVDTLIIACRHRALAWIAKDALVQIGAPAVDPLIAALKHQHPDVRFWAIRALGELGDSRAIEPLQRHIAHDIEPTNQQLARTTLKNLLIASLDSADLETRLAAVQGLRWLDDTRAVENLYPLAEDDPDPAIRRAAQDAIHTLIASVNVDPFAEHDLPVRMRTTNLLFDKLSRIGGVVLPKVGTPDDFDQEAPIIDTLHHLMTTHENSDVRSVAQDALKRLTLDYVRCRYPAARRIAVQGLYALDDDHAHKLLRQIAEFDPDESVRQAATRSAL